MSVSYQAVGWNAFKKRYDLWLLVGVVVFLGAFIGVSLGVNPEATLEIMLIRATATAAVVLLHVILMSGPLARLDRRWLPVVYNRRHLGVTFFILALVHAVLVLVTYHVGSDINPVLSVFVSDSGPGLGGFPFQAVGAVALVIFFLMAATSHDFWLANLTAPVWKTLHMLVYLAYALVVVHVVFGVLQAESSVMYGMLMLIGVVAVAGLHVMAGLTGRALDRELEGEGFVEVCALDELEPEVPRGAVVGGERVAVLLWEGKVSAVSGVCQHQNGPLAEGKFVFGCLTCPWHGYQYKPDCGKSPEPFTEEIPTFDVRVEDGKVFVKSVPNAAGTYVEPVAVEK